MKNELNESQKNNDFSIILTPEQEAIFQKNVKIGIYKELHRKGLLTDAQLNQLISLQNT